MARSKTTNVATPNADALAQLMAMMQGGQDVTQLQAQAQQRALYEEALSNEGFGVMTVSINGAIGFQTDSSGNITILARFLSEENSKAQDGSPLADYLDKILKVNPDLEVQIIVGEGFLDKLSDKRESIGGNLKVTFTVSNLCELRQVQARYNKDEEDMEKANQPIFLINPDGDRGDMSNWTTENTGFPLKKLRLRVQVKQALSWEKAPMIMQRLPELDELLTVAATAQQVQERNLAGWVRRVQAASQAQMTQTDDAVTAAMNALNNP